MERLGFQVGIGGHALMSPHSSPGDLARSIATVNFGVAVQSASGADRDELLQVAQLVLQSWPS